MRMSLHHRIHLIPLAAAAFVSPDAFGIGSPGKIKMHSLIEMGLGTVIGAITFTGSIVAFAGVVLSSLAAVFENKSSIASSTPSLSRCSPKKSPQPRAASITRPART